MTRINILLLSAFTLLFGCSTGFEPAVGERDETPMEIPEEDPVFGNLTLIRIEPEPAPPEVLIYIHDELAAVVGNESFVTLLLPQGTNTLTLDWEDSPIRFEEVIVMEPDLQSEKYLSMIRKFEVPDIARTTNSTDYTMIETIGFFELPPQMGEKVIKNLDPDFSYTAPEYVE